MKQFAKLLSIGFLGGTLILSGCGASRTLQGVWGLYQQFPDKVRHIKKGGSA